MFEQKTVKETCSELKSDTHKGLTEMEAGRRLRMDGKNCPRKDVKILSPDFWSSYRIR